MKKSLLPLFTLTLLFALTGCGQSGGLYLPQDVYEVNQHQKDVYLLPQPNRPATPVAVPAVVPDSAAQ